MYRAELNVLSYEQGSASTSDSRCLSSGGYSRRTTTSHQCACVCKSFQFQFRMHFVQHISNFQPHLNLKLLHMTTLPNPAEATSMSGLRTYRNFSLEDTPSLTSKVAVVTGGSDGIGKEIVAQLLLHDIGKVYVLSRKREKFDLALKYWMVKGLAEGLEGRVEFVACDLNDMTIVKAVSDALMGRLSRLDILINNAGSYPSVVYRRVLIIERQHYHPSRTARSRRRALNLYGQPT